MGLYSVFLGVPVSFISYKLLPSVVCQGHSDFQLLIGREAFAGPETAQLHLLRSDARREGRSIAGPWRRKCNSCIKAVLYYGCRRFILTKTVTAVALLHL